MSALGGADGKRASDVGRAVFVLAAGIDEKQFAGGDAPVAAAADAVMHDGAVRSGAGDGRERDVFQHAGIAAEALQGLDGIDLGQASLRRFAIEPGQKARHCGAVAQLRGFGAGDLGLVLDRLHRHDRIAAAQHLAAVISNELGNRFRTDAGIEPRRALRLAERGEIALEFVVGAYVRQFLETMPHLVVELAAIDVERRATVLRHDGGGEHDRRVRHIMAADVEQPRHRLRIGHDQRIGFGFVDLARTTRLSLSEAASPA